MPLAAPGHPLRPLARGRSLYHRHELLAIRAHRPESFSAGLTLYWTVNNILTIIQLQVYNRQQKAAQ